MNKTAIKNFAVWARRELIEKISQKALQYGITEKKIEDADADSINGKLLTPSEKTQRKALINKIKIDGYQKTIEEIAYTWFNRFIALRFMEVNDYLPEHIRVFTNENNEFKPQILTEAITIDLVGLDKKKVFAFKEANDDEGLYRYLIIAQCNALNEILPGMFQKINDYTELLFPDFLLRSDSVIDHLIFDIDKDDWNPATEDGQIEILGWLYQYYISEKHSEVIDPLHGKTIEKNDIPAATQLFTTDWVVKYIVDNSVGRYWIERNPNSKLKEKLIYYVSRRTTPEVTINESITPQDITVFDPCMGSGHFLVYAFEVLMEIYREYGYSDRDAANEIVKTNLYGLDIDDRASQLAYFAIMMKARQYDQRILTRNIEPKLYSIQESDSLTDQQLDAFSDSKELKIETRKLVESFKNAKELGSIIQVPEINYAIIKDRIAAIKKDSDLFLVEIANRIDILAKQSLLLSKKYAIVDTNPPYFNKYSKSLNSYINQYYKDYSGDLFSVFIARNFNYCKENGYCSFMTPNVWMSIKSYEKLRSLILNEKEIVTLIQMAHGSFSQDACVDVASFVFFNGQKGLPGIYVKLSDYKGDMTVQEEYFLKTQDNKECNYRFETYAKDLALIPDIPITAFSASKKMLHVYDKSVLLKTIANPKQGLATADNNRFLRQWYEVEYKKINFNINTIAETKTDNHKWYPYNKGGNFRKWYGNNDYIVNWENDGNEIRNFTDENGNLRSRPQNTQFYFNECISWSLISSYTISFRYKPKGFIFDIAGMSCFNNSKIPLQYLLALTNSCLIGKIMLLLAPTINYQSGNIANIPVIYNEEKSKTIIDLVKENIEITKNDWDLYETSWDYKQEPLIYYKTNNSLKDSYENYKSYCNNLFNKLAENEVELNKIFLEIYELSDELGPEVSRRDISATYIYDTKNEIPEDIKESYYVRTKVDIVKNFISYAVGCMFGRYSLDKEGLVFAGGVFDPNNYKTFEADKDAIIPICDDDSFSDDIVTRFVEFVSKVYGKDTLEENLRFIADALGGNGTSRDVIRNYFINGFYKDHVQTYQKRPIYWLFDSGKNNGLKCLVYMHRYSKDTIARIRTDYVHDRQGVYENRMEELNNKIKAASGAEKIKLSNQLKDTKAKAEELHKYEEKIHHLADQMIEIDLDDGVKHNYEIFKDVLAPLK